MTQPLVGADATGMMANAEMPRSPPVDTASLPTTVAWALPEHYTNVSIDRAFKANLARLTFGVSPVALAQPYFDWLAHLITSPGKQIQLVENAVRTSAHLAAYVYQAVTNADIPLCITPLPQDHRFQATAWRRWPYCAIYQSFLLAQQWWHNATTGVDGGSAADERAVSFSTAIRWRAPFSCCDQMT